VLVILNGLSIPQAEDARSLELHFDHRLNWKNHIFTKQKQFGFHLGKIYWLFSSKSQLSAENKLLLYKAILKHIWTKVSNCRTWLPIQIQKYYKNAKTNTLESHRQYSLVRYQQYSTS